MERCQDLAQESVAPNPTEKDIFKAQVLHTFLTPALRL